MTPDSIENRTAAQERVRELGAVLATSKDINVVASAQKERDALVKVLIG